MQNKDELIRYFRNRFSPTRGNPEEISPLEPGVAPRGYTRPQQPAAEQQNIPTQGLFKGLEPGVAPRGYTRPATATAKPQIDQSASDEDHHLNRMWNALTPEEKQGLFGGLMSGKVKMPNISRSNQVTMPRQTGLDRSGYIPTWYRERFGVVQPSITEPLIPRAT